MSSSVRYRILISGRVQGVGYRFFVLDAAEHLGLRGWVRNLPDGRVEAEIEGAEELVNELVKQLQVGPRLSHVASVVVEPAEGTIPCQDFQIR